MGREGSFFISKISSSGGEYDKGYIDASLEIKPDLWFFYSHFINDPVMLKIDEDCYWFSLADGDALLWVQGIAAGYKFDVDIHEPDVSPLQVQGPNSKKLMAKVFGDWVNDLGFYRFKEVNHEGIPMVIAKMGYSRELCYEIFLKD